VFASHPAPAQQALLHWLPCRPQRRLAHHGLVLCRHVPAGRSSCTFLPGQAGQCRAGASGQAVLGDSSIGLVAGYRLQVGRGMQLDSHALGVIKARAAHPTAAKGRTCDRVEIGRVMTEKAASTMLNDAQRCWVVMEASSFNDAQRCSRGWVVIEAAIGPCHSHELPLLPRALASAKSSRKTGLQQGRASQNRTKGGPAASRGAAS